MLPWGKIDSELDRPSISIAARVFVDVKLKSAPGFALGILYNLFFANTVTFPTASTVTRLKCHSVLLRARYGMVVVWYTR